MEIKMEKSITMLMLSLKISACLESQEPLGHSWFVSYVPIGCSSVAFRDPQRMQYEMLCKRCFLSSAELTLNYTSLFSQVLHELTEVPVAARSRHNLLELPVESVRSRSAFPGLRARRLRLFPRLSFCRLFPFRHLL